MKKILILVSLFIISFPIFFLRSTAIKAVDPSPEAETDVTDKIKERLKETAEQGLETIKTELEQKATQPKKKAFVGSLESISADQFSLNYKDVVYTVSFSETTVFEKSAGHVALEASDLKPNDFILALGFLTDTDKLDARRVLIIAPPSPAPVRQLLSGLIEEIDGSKVSIDNKVLTITNNTNLAIKGIEEPSLDDLELGDHLFALVSLDENGDIETVLTVLVLPGKNNPAGMTPTNAEASESAEATPAAETETTE
jgi:hypothetical protein